MGLPHPATYTPPHGRDWFFVPWTIEPRIVLRRDEARFFGKTLKVDATVTSAPRPRLPRLLPPRHFRRAPPRDGSALAVLAAAAAIASVNLWLCERAAAQPPAGPADSVYRRSASPAEQGVDDQGAQAERIVAAALAALGRTESISARVRARVRLDDRVLVGAGRYVQSGIAEDQRYRYEASLKADTETFELLEVCDGVHAWSYRRIGPQPPLLERLDVRRVRERLEQLQPGAGTPVSPHLGGLQRSLALLRTWFRFRTVEATGIEDLPVWRVEGRLEPVGLALLLPDRKEAIGAAEGISAAALPDGVPWGVRLWIGKRDLFPFRIEWLAIPGRRPVPEGEAETTAVLELYDVQLGAPVDASAFVYKPAIEGFVDLTETCVKHLAPLRP